MLNDGSIKSGLYDMTNEQYHSSAGISKSGLDLMAQSPRHFWHRYLNPNYKPNDETAATVLGTAIHTAILEPDDFTKAYANMPENLTRTTKAGKEFYAELIDQGKTVLKYDDYQYCLGIRDAVHKHPIAGKLLMHGKAEQSFFCTEPETDLLIKCRPDWITDSGIMVDIKSTESASPDGFAKSVANYRYYVQAPWYLDILERLYSDAPEHFVFVAIEKSEPHAIGVYILQDSDIQRGRDRYRADLMKVKKCLDENFWPDFSTEIETLKLPSWLKA